MYVQTDEVVDFASNTIDETLNKRRHRFDQCRSLEWAFSKLKQRKCKQSFNNHKFRQLTLEFRFLSPRSFIRGVSSVEPDLLFRWIFRWLGFHLKVIHHAPRSSHTLVCLSFDIYKRKSTRKICRTMGVKNQLET